IKSIMKPYILSDNTINSIQDNFKNEMNMGLMTPDKATLPITVTFVTERFIETEGEYVAICAHAQNFSITLVNLKRGTLPKVFRKDYNINDDVYKQSYKKIYEVFVECLKDFFCEFQLGGAVIPVAFCSNLPMKHFSLDTAIIPYFKEHFNSYPCCKDVKSYFDHIACKYGYQGNLKTSLSRISATTSADSKEKSNSAEIYHAQFEAKYLGNENILGLDVNAEICHKMLEKMEVYIDASQSLQDVLLDISPSGIDIQDKSFKNVLHHHSFNKISYITQDFANPHVFGYVFGDYYKGHQFFGFKTVCESTKAILFLQEVLNLELMQKKKEELNMKASQVFLELKNFLNVAQDLNAKDREIPLDLKKKVKLVEDIFWWLEGCSGNITPTSFESEDIALNVKLHDLYIAAVTKKLIEKEHEEEVKKTVQKATKRHSRKKNVKKVEEKPVISAKLPLSSSEKMVIELLKKHSTYFQSALKNKKQKNKLLMKKILKLTNEDIVSDKDIMLQEASTFLEKFCSQTFEEMRTESNDLKQKIESINQTEISEREKLPVKVFSINFGQPLFLKAVKIKPKEKVFEEIFLKLPEKNLNISEVSNAINICKHYFSNALKIRKEEVNDLNYIISALHFRENRLPSEETSAIILSRKLLVIAANRRLREIKDIELNLTQLNKAEDFIIFAVPDAHQFCKDIYVIALLKLEEKLSFIQEVSSKLTDESAIDVFSLCYKFFKEAIRNRKKEFDELVNNLDLLEATEIDDADNEGIEFVNDCKDTFLSSIIFREKEIEILEKEFKKVSDFSRMPHPEVVITLKDIFYAALELEKQKYENILLIENEKDCDKEDEILPVIYTFKDMFDSISLNLKKKHIEESDDPTSAKTLQIYTSLEEFLTMAFELKQKEIEIPLEVLKQDLENVVSSMIEEVRKREMERISEFRRRIQALQILNSWKEVFLEAASLRKSEILEVVPVKLKETKEEEAVIKALLQDERHNLDAKGRKIADAWRKIFSHVNDMKKYEVEQIKKLLRKPDVTTSEENTEQEDHTTIHGDVAEMEYFEEDSEEDEGGPQAELIRVVKTCKSIFNIVVKKGSSELEEMEHDMKPIFNTEYDEETVDCEEDEVSIALNTAKQIFKDFGVLLKERESQFLVSIETISFLEDNIKSQMLLAQETAKRYMLEELDKERNGLAFIMDNIEQLDKVFSGLVIKPTQDLRSFTDLVVDVLSSEEIKVPEKNQDDELEESEKPEVEEEKSPTFTREQIEALLFEIEEEQKGEDEEEIDPQKLEAIDVYTSCKEFLNSVAEFHIKNIQTLQFESEKLDAVPRKKLKKKDKVKKALQNIAACKRILNNLLESTQSVSKLMQQEVDKIAKAYAKEAETETFKSSEIVAVSRKLFSSFVEARRNNLHLMKVELGLLQAKENASMAVESDGTTETADILKNEILDSCKELVIGSIDIKMKEVDDISSNLEALNDIEQKIDAQLSLVDTEERTEEMKASYTKLEKVKDAVSTCTKLSKSAIDKAKRGLKEADTELKMLKDVLDVVEDSVVTATCIYILKTSIERREAEIYALTKVLKTMEAGSSNLEVTEDDLEKYLTQYCGIDDLESEVHPEVPQIEPEPEAEDPDVLFDELVAVEGKSRQDILKENNKSSTLEADDSEHVVMSTHISLTSTSKAVKDRVKLQKIIGFLQESLSYLQIRLLSKQEAIEQVTVDLDKLKDAKVFDICHDIILNSVETLKQESLTIANELKNLNKINIDEVAANFEEIEFLANCKRILNNAIKNRNNQNSLIEFEMMKLVRYQDSRIVQICKEQFVFLQESANVEIDVIKEKIKRIERMGHKQELLDMCKKVFQEFIQMVNATIQLTESVLLSVVEKKLKIEVEEEYQQKEIYRIFRKMCST
ncbi:hexokinase, partial [Caerostris darwini]